MFSSFKWKQKQTGSRIFSIESLLNDYYILTLMIEKAIKTPKNSQHKDSNRILVNFHVFPDSAQQTKLEQHQGHFQLDGKVPYHGAHRRSSYDIHDKNWITLKGIKNRYQEIMFYT